MKKLLFVLGLMAFSSAHASYLYWQVTSENLTEYSSSGTLYASLWAKDSAGKVTLLDGKYEAPLAATTSNLTIGEVDYGTNAYSYYIELGAYDSTTDKYSDVVRNAFTYEDLSKHLVKAMSEIQSVTAYVGSQYKATPEPTSGLMMLMGLALLGLKRRQV